MRSAQYLYSSAWWRQTPARSLPMSTTFEQKRVTSASEQGLTLVHFTAQRNSSTF
jgi:hypothetical protein